MTILNYWQINLIGYLICMALFCHHYKKAVKDSNAETASTILLQLIGAGAILLLIPLSKFQLPNSPSSYIFLVIASVFYAINNRLQTSARKNLEMSAFSVISQMSFVFLAILSFIFLKEQPTLAKLAAIGFILGGNCLILINRGGLALNKHIALAVLASLSASAGVFISIGVSKEFNLPFYIALTFLLPALMLKAFGRVRIDQIIKTYERGKKSSYLTAGICWGMAIYFSLKAMHLGEVSIVAPLQAASVLMNVVSGYLFLEEKSLIFRKVAAAALIVMGIYINVS